MVVQGMFLYFVCSFIYEYTLKTGFWIRLIFDISKLEYSIKLSSNYYSDILPKRNDNMLRHCGPHRELSPPRTIAVPATASPARAISSSSVAHVTRMWCMRVCWARAHRRPPPKQDGRPGELNEATVSGGCSEVGQRRLARGRTPRTTSHHAHTHTHASSAAERTTGENRSYCFARSRSCFISPPPSPKHILLRMRVRVCACKYGTCACNVTSPIYTHIIYISASPPRRRHYTAAG